MSSTSYFPFLVIVLMIKSILIGGLIYIGLIGLGPDEAQYWTWSQLLDWGYYSKPPGIAWQIALGTSLFGQNEFGVRFFSLVLSFLQACIIYFMALASGFPARIAFWCGLAMAFSPIGILGSLFAITDGGFLLFWSLACLVVISSLLHGSSPSPIGVGIIIAFGALFKWPMYAFWIVYGASVWFYNRSYSFLNLTLGFLVSLMGLLPSIWWGYHHDWATFRHVGATLKGGSGTIVAAGNPLEFLGSQVALMSPILFVILVVALVAFFRKHHSLTPAVKLMTWTFLVGFSLFFMASFFQKIQGNWSLAIYPSAFILMGWFADTHLKWLQRGTLFTLCFTPILILVAALGWLPHKMNPLKHNLGLQNLQNSLIEAGFGGDGDYLIGDTYQTTSQLSFYNDQHQRAFFLNLHGARNNQFCYWPGICSKDSEQTGFMVSIVNATRTAAEMKRIESQLTTQLKDYFAEVSFCGNYPLSLSGDKAVKCALIFKCRHYNGMPANRSINY